MPNYGDANCHQDVQVGPPLCPIMEMPDDINMWECSYTGMDLFKPISGNAHIWTHGSLKYI